MENEIRYYLKQIKQSIDDEQFTPTHIITAVKLPTGAKEVAINTEYISEKIDYILGAYDDNMFLKTNGSIQMLNIMIV